MTVVKNGSEAWALRKVDEDLLDVSQRKNGFNPLSRAIMKES